VSWNDVASFDLMMLGANEAASCRLLSLGLWPVETQLLFPSPSTVTVWKTRRIAPLDESKDFPLLRIIRRFES
jgi:hypothetical protein